MFLHNEIKITRIMKRGVYIISFILTILLIILLADKELEPKNLLEKDDDWSLVWSDEFNGEIINNNNWNYQIEKAGRFNDEWQSYTDSEKNAFIDNGKLVINAIHLSKDHGMNKYTSARLNSNIKKNEKIFMELCKFWADNTYASVLFIIDKPIYRFLVPLYRKIIVGVRKISSRKLIFYSTHHFVVIIFI